MKKIMGILLLFITCVAFVGCSFGSNEKEALSSSYYHINRNDNNTINDIKIVSFVKENDSNVYTVKEIEYSYINILHKPNGFSSTFKTTGKWEKDTLLLDKQASNFRICQFDMKKHTMTNAINIEYKALNNENKADLEKAIDELKEQQKKVEEDRKNHLPKFLDIINR